MTFYLRKQCYCFILFPSLQFFLIGIFFTIFCYKAAAQSLYSYGESPAIPALPAGSLIRMADGSEKPVEQIKDGDMLAAYDPAIEQLVATTVLNNKFNSYDDQPSVSIILILEELSAPLQMNGGTIGIILKVGSAHPVLTQWGKKEASQLQEGDKVYCYDEVTARFYTFSVHGVSPDEQPVSGSYQLMTDKQNYIVNGAVLLDN